MWALQPTPHCVHFRCSDRLLNRSLVQSRLGHIQGSMNAKGGNPSKHFTSEQKYAAVELCKAKVPLKTIRRQLQMGRSTLQKILNHAKQHPESPIVPRKSGTGKKAKITQETKEKMKNLLRKDPCLTAKQLKGRISGLATVSIRRIQAVCKNDLNLPSMRMANIIYNI